MREILITKIPFADHLADLVKDRVHVVQEFPPRVIVVEGDEGAVFSVAGLPDVLSGAKLNAFREQLTRAERMFVDAWVLANSKEEKARKYDGLSWGAFGKGP